MLSSGAPPRAALRRLAASRSATGLRNLVQQSHAGSSLFRIDSADSLGRTRDK